MPETNLTRLVLANKSKSLRTTIPAHIIRQFDLKEGDQLEWSLEVKCGKMALGVNPKKSR